MAKVERQQPILQVGETIQVKQVSLDGEELSVEQMVVDEAGQPRVIAQVGRVQLTETRFKLRPQSD